MSATIWRGVELPQAESVAWSVEDDDRLLCGVYGDTTDFVAQSIGRDRVALHRLGFATHPPDAQDESEIRRNLTSAGIVALAFVWAQRVKAWVDASPDPAAAHATDDAHDRVIPDDAAAIVFRQSNGGVSVDFIMAEGTPGPAAGDDAQVPLVSFITLKAAGLVIDMMRALLSDGEDD